MANHLALEALEAELSYVRRQLSEVPESSWGTARLMWESRLADIETRKAEISSSISHYAKVTLVFDGSPVIASRKIRLDFAVDALESYQNIVAHALASNIAGKLPKRGRLPGADQSKLYIRDLARGSVGFILEESPDRQTVLMPTALKRAVEGASEIIRKFTESSEEDFEDVLETMQPRLVTAMQKFAMILQENGASTNITVGLDMVALSAADVGRISYLLQEVQINELTELVDGRILGILPDSGQFELQLADGDEKIIRGITSEDIAATYSVDAVFREQLVVQDVRVQIKRVQTVRRGHVVREQYVLESINPTDQAKQIVGPNDSADRQ